MARYKVGDRVRVRDDLQFYRRYYMNDGIHKDSFVPGMESMCGKFVTIESTINYKYQIVENSMNWTDEMFEEAVAIRVSNDDLVGFL